MDVIITRKQRLGQLADVQNETRSETINIMNGYLRSTVILERCWLINSIIHDICSISESLSACDH